MRTAAAVSREGALYPAIEELDLEPPRAGEVLVRIVASGICHTDLRAGASGGAGTRGLWCSVTKAQAWFRKSVKASPRSRRAITSC
jgi:hypothetical protein